MDEREQMTQTTNHEAAYVLMMDALDGELSASGKITLEAHLRACPACEEEWQALVAVDFLFKHTPLLEPAPNFAQQTVSQLPEERPRIWTLATIYLTLLVTGIVPILGLGWLFGQLQPLLQLPAFGASLQQAFTKAWQLGGAFLGALWQILASLGDFVGQNPTIVGWAMVMIGFIAVWSGVYSQLMNQPALAVIPVPNQNA